MTLSVIIPNYNNEKFISECLDSVLSQTLLPDEIIVVDDCSTDNSPSIIKQYQEKFDVVKGIYLTENHGVSHARNTGIMESTSEYVTFLDADDFYFNKDKLKNEMTLQEKMGSNVLTYSKLVYADENSQIIRYVDYPIKHYHKGNAYTRLLLGYRSNIFIRDFCVRKETVIYSGLYDENMNLFEDFDFLLRIAEKTNVYCTNEYGTAYRQTTGGLSKRPEKVVINTKNSVSLKYISKFAPLKKISTYIEYFIYCKLYKSVKKVIKKLL